MEALTVTDFTLDSFNKNQLKSFLNNLQGRQQE